MNLQERIAARAVAHIPPGAIVNLGIGIPTFVADHLPLDSVALQTENGLLGVGPTPGPGEADPDLVHAGKQPVTARPGASYFASSASFGMIRGGHVDVAVLGALQVDARGRIANWAVPGKPVLGVGGAMDLLVGARTVVVTTTHTTKDGSPKIVDGGDLPADRAAAGRRCGHRGRNLPGPRRRARAGRAGRGRDAGLGARAHHRPVRRRAGEEAVRCVTR